MHHSTVTGTNKTKVVRKEAGKVDFPRHEASSTFTRATSSIQLLAMPADHPCPICFEPAPKRSVTTGCCHTCFHAACLGRWRREQRLKSHTSTCPCCRAAIDAEGQPLPWASGGPLPTSEPPLLYSEAVAGQAARLRILRQSALQARPRRACANTAASAASGTVPLALSRAIEPADSHSRARCTRFSEHCAACSRVRCSESQR